MARVITPHDAALKTFLSRMEIVQDLIEFHLSPSSIKVCKLGTLHLELDSFVEDDLRPHFSDILYSLEAASGHGYVHVLTEHQSSPDKHMSFRLTRYTIAAIQRHLGAGNGTLPLVIPVPFYHGKQSPW